MAKQKQPKKRQSDSAAKIPLAGATAVAPSPYLPVAHPPAKNPTLLAVSVILFVVWFIFLLMAAYSSLSR